MFVSETSPNLWWPHSLEPKGKGENIWYLSTAEIWFTDKSVPQTLQPPCFYFVLFCHLLSGTTRCFGIILYTYCTVLESAISPRSPGFFYWSSIRNQDLGMTIDFSATIIETRREWNVIFTRLREITISRIEFVFPGWGQNKGISRKTKLEFPNNKLSQKELLKEIS